MIEDSIRRFLVEELSADGSKGSLPDDYPLLDRQVLDSLGMFHLVGYLESEFDVEILDEELVPEHFGTIRDIAQLVQAKRP